MKYYGIKEKMAAGCFLVLCGLAAGGCGDDYDDSALAGRVGNLENRVESLERQCTQMNANISALQRLVDASQSGVSITRVTPLEENGVEVGYTIEFTSGEPITIYHGRDGQDGQDGQDGADGEDGRDGLDGTTPVIGVAVDTDGIYYWTLNGTWLTDDQGNKVKAQGTDGRDGQDGADGEPGQPGQPGDPGQDGQDGAPGQPGEPGQDGKDGITPLLKIENGRWMLSTDSGATWNDIGQATGDPGKDGADGRPGQDGQDGADGDSFFQSIDYTTSADYVVFTLADGTQLQLPTWYAFDNLKSRCEQLNEELRTLRSLVEAVQARDAITRVETLVEDGQEVGYTLYFEQCSPINIYHGRDGQDGEPGQPGEPGQDGQDGAPGAMPLIGVRQDTDGLYYWTLNGDWLTDESGNKVKAQGTDGQDGAPGQPGEPGKDGSDGTTPQLKIETDGYWYISYNNGSTWTKLGKATGEDGQDGAPGQPGEPGQDGQPGKDGVDGDSFFQAVTQDDDYVYLTLASGDETIAVPKHKPLSITFSETEDIRVLPSQTYTIQYTVTGATDKTLVKALAQDGFRAVVKSNGVSEGIIEITTPATILSSEVLVFVTDGEERTILRSINFVEGVINITNSSYVAPAIGGTVDVEFSTNIDYTVEIPAEAQSWIAIAPAARTAMRDETISFVVQPNNGTELRYAIISLKDKEGIVTESIQIKQNSSTQSVDVATAGSLKQLINSEEVPYIECLKLTGHLNETDYDFLKTMPNLKTLDLSEVQDEYMPRAVFSESKISTVLLPSKLKAIPAYAFYYSSVTSIDIPETVESIGNVAFLYSNLKGDLVIPSSTTTIGSSAFNGCAITSLTLNEGIQTIGMEAFYGCRKVTGDLIIPNSVIEIGERAFAHSTFTGSLYIGSGLKVIPKEAFSTIYSQCFSGTLTIGENVESIGDRAFSGCGFGGDLVIPDKVKVIGESAFESSSSWEGYDRIVIGASVEEIGDKAFAVGRYQEVYSKPLTPPQLVGTPFSNPTTLHVINVNDGYPNRYETNSQWKELFSTIKLVNEIE